LRGIHLYYRKKFHFLENYADDGTSSQPLFLVQTAVMQIAIYALKMADGIGMGLEQ